MVFDSGPTIPDGNTDDGIKVGISVSESDPFVSDVSESVSNPDVGQ